MKESSIVHSTFVLERSYPKTAESVFTAFANIDLKRRWYAEGDGNELEQFDLDFRVGGIENYRYKLKPGTPVAGMVITNESRYHVIVPDLHIVSSATMDLGEKRILVALVTVQFQSSASGTELTLTHQGTYLDGINGLTPQMLEIGWSKLLDNLHIELTRLGQ